MKLFNWNSLTKNKQLEKRFIMAICLLAMMRVFIFGSAFPFFSNVDEPYHYDVVVKYSKGYFLKSNKIEHFDPAAAKTIALYGTLEYLHDIEKEGPFPPPLWKVSNDTEAVKYLDKNVNYFLGLQEIEINSPPVYLFQSLVNPKNNLHSYQDTLQPRYHLRLSIKVAGRDLLFQYRANILKYHIMRWFLRQQDQNAQFYYF